MEQITSRSNPLAAQIRKLNSARSARREQGLFVGEGPKLLEEALRAGAELTAVVHDGRRPCPLPPEAREVAVPPELLRSLADTQTPQGVLFLCRQPSLALPETLPGERFLVLDGVQDPGNVGTIWRTADAFGADGLILLPGCADPFSPKTVRATMGACFRLPAWETDLAGLTHALKLMDLPLYATALRADTDDVRRADLGRCAVVIGSEGRGVSQAVLDACAGTLKIPMRQRCESLNAAVAASVVLWEMARPLL